MFLTVLILLWAIPIAGTVALVAHCAIVDWRKRRRWDREDAARAAAVEARRDHEDAEWKGVEDSWHAFLDRWPVQGWDSERLGS